jgi:8-oxo-dGTP diphosphatase
LIQRAAEPFIGMWALPGWFVQMDEGLDDAARRELEEETGLKATHLEQLYTFGRPDRDPRGRVITVVYLVLLPECTHKKVEGRDDAARADRFSVGHLPTLAYDHAEILACALARLDQKRKV